MILQMICPSMAVAMDLKFTGNGSGHPESRNGLNRCVLEIVGFPGLFSPTCFGHVAHIRHHLGQAIETFGEPQRRTPRSKAGDTNMKIHLDSLSMSSWMPHPAYHSTTLLFSLELQLCCKSQQNWHTETGEQFNASKVEHRKLHAFVGRVCAKKTRPHIFGDINWY